MRKAVAETAAAIAPDLPLHASTQMSVHTVSGVRALWEMGFKRVVLEEVTREGDRLRRVHDLALVRSQSPLFVMTWTAMHLLDETSPLVGFTERALLAGDVRFIITFTGIDGTFAQTVHARHIYLGEDIVWGARFADMMTPLPDGRLQLDYGRFHTIERLAPPSSAPSASTTLPS